MKLSTRKIKEEKMILAAEQVFFTVGFANAKMEDIARQANCSKTTLYTYFDSKENLYMAITYRAFESLMEVYYNALDTCYEASGLIRVTTIFKEYLTFSEDKFNYQQLLLEYLTVIRAISGKGQESKMTEPLKHSQWFRRVKDMHNKPLTVMVQQIRAGQKDGSITNQNQPEEIFLTIWSLIIGFTKLTITTGDSKGATLFQVNLNAWKQRLFKLIEGILIE